MDKSFDPKAVEARWYPQWEQSGAFAPTAQAEAFCILLPPPNVTGTLHMGHAFQQTLMDLMVRYQRMRGRSVLWQCGTDHAGIATQKIVENQLAAVGESRHDLGREGFIDRVWQWKEQSGSQITQQMRRLGASCDWSRERFTMDEGLSAAVRKVFVDWYRDGLIYRGKRLVHWDPVLMTAVSDLEVNNEERNGHLWSIRYPTADGGEGVVVATTRPETMLGDVAVAVHPSDERYAHLVGTQLVLPLTGRTIPVIADAYVDREFGTGCVKITPAHDFNDYQIGQRHRIEPMSIFTLDGRVNELAPEVYQGLDRFEARKRVLADLEAQGLLVETKPHKLSIPISQRTDAVIEPMLTDQWFVDLTSETQPDGRPGGKTAITDPALNAVLDGQIRFVPENWSTTYRQWLENIQDWCVSRQLWWGHQIPAWYDEAGTIFVGHDQEEAVAWAAAQGLPAPQGELTRDPDVLDTWFSSALWPFSTLGWPGDSPERAAEWADFQRFVPSSVMVTGFDIIFFWVARMVMATTYFVGRQPDGSYSPERSQLAQRIPFETVYINAIVRDAEGQKMSKSKGNTIDPLDLIDGISLDTLVAKSTASLLIPQLKEKVEKRIRRDYPEGITPVGADALRFTFAALATHGRTINFDMQRCEGYKNFCNKLWNAARFVAMNLEGLGPGAQGPGGCRALPSAESAAERWILGRLVQTCAEYHQHIAEYRFDLAAQAVYAFVWDEYCDWFLELAKPAMQGDDAARKASTTHTLLHVLEAVLRLLHPITPFITEEIWQHLKPHFGVTEAFLGEAPQPYAEADQPRPAVDADADADVQWLQACLSGIRKIRGEMNLSPGKPLDLLLTGGGSVDRERIEHYTDAFALLARIQSHAWLESGVEPPASAMALVGELKLLVPLAGLIDVDAELKRLDKEIGKVAADLAKAEAKLANPKFVGGAPEAVINQERQRVSEFGARKAELEAQRGKLAAG
ncbi:MAG: valine--tRNA ligase [Xanthomonadales bacterium]|nr:valine--tRNA ligase [Xanthomonadales bacterium]